MVSQFYRRLTEEMTQKRWENMPVSQPISTGTGSQVRRYLASSNYYFIIDYLKDIFWVRILEMCAKRHHHRAVVAWSKVSLKCLVKWSCTYCFVGTKHTLYCVTFIHSYTHSHISETVTKSKLRLCLRKLGIWLKKTPLSIYSLPQGGSLSIILEY